ncbi:hypothetical protein [Mesoterricola sediminis]|uniref:Uncharacterized protein n=1 Tax=Mesoterricola sediminis TaxID=2927980 RepID=A0AA48KFB6_9BACT|nr:hypothetical protein [Mesoterricola sediminis]BDU76283.1 hypothetical protein METESE_12410 [Mesoterricola sediminis]
MRDFALALAAFLSFAAMLSFRVWFPRQPYVNRTARILWWLGLLGAIGAVLTIAYAVGVRRA